MILTFAPFHCSFNLNCISVLLMGFFDGIFFCKDRVFLAMQPN